MITRLLNEINEKIEKLNNLVQDKEYFKKLDERIEKVNNYIEEQKQEIERLNNIINETEKWLEEDYNKTLMYEIADYPRYYLDTFEKILKGSEKE